MRWCYMMWGVATGGGWMVGGGAGNRCWTSSPGLPLPPSLAFNLIGDYNFIIGSQVSLLQNFFNYWQFFTFEKLKFYEIDRFDKLWTLFLYLKEDINMRYNLWLLVPPAPPLSPGVWAVLVAVGDPGPVALAGQAGVAHPLSPSVRQGHLQSYNLIELLSTFSLPSQLEGLSEFTLQTDAHLPSQSYLNIAETIVHSSYLVSGMDQQLPASTELCRSCCIFLVHFYPSSWVSDWPGLWLIGAGGEDGISRSHLTVLSLSPEWQAYDGDELGEGGVVMSW